jgi:hypothetical protein
MHTDSKTAEFGEHRRDPAVIERMSQENAYILKKHGNYIEGKWRLLGYLMRIIDGSAIIMLLNRLFYIGRDVTKCFKIDYSI